MANEHENWRKFLSPLVSGLVGLIAALTVTYQSPKTAETEARLDAIDGRLEVLDYRTTSVEELRGDVKALSADVNKILGLIEIDRSRRK